MPLATLPCAGVCQPAGGAEECADSVLSGCRGLTDAESCAGICTGACQLELDAPATCAGTCFGSCDGECGDDPTDCEGPCTGLCTGECRLLSSDACDGECTGLCDDAAMGVPACDAPLEPYCLPFSGVLPCTGDCFGEASLEFGAAACRPSALAAGRALPRCEPALVQLSFAFRPDGDVQLQTGFALAVDALNAPFAELFEALARLELLELAAADLEVQAQAVIPARLSASLDENPGDGGLACAEQHLPEVGAWLAGETGALAQLHAEAMQLLAPLTITE